MPKVTVLTLCKLELTLAGKAEQRETTEYGLSATAAIACF